MEERNLSIDVLRGLLVVLMVFALFPGVIQPIHSQFLLSSWHGVTVADVLFPGFLFVSGLSLSISLKQGMEKSRTYQWMKIIKRTVILFSMGLALNWMLPPDHDWSTLRIFGVLQRIALAYFFVSIILLYSNKWKFISVMAIVLMLAHWLLLYSLGTYEPYSITGNFAGVLDQMVVGKAHLFQGLGEPFDPEGLLGLLTSSAQILLGYVIGYQITSQEVDKDSVTFLLVAGVLCGGVGYAWSSWLPLNKSLWTASFVCFTTGIFTLILCAIIEIIDIKQKTRLAFLFQVFGVNSLLSFLVAIGLSQIVFQCILIDSLPFHTWLFKHGYLSTMNERVGSLLFSLVVLLLMWTMMWPFWKRKLSLGV